MTHKIVSFLVLGAALLTMAIAESRIGGAPKIGPPFDVIPFTQQGGGPESYFHGPTTIVARNGDLLVATGQGRSHGIGVVVQSRSKDKGATWQFEGVVYDHAKSTPGGTAYNPAYALAPDGTLVLVIQTSIAQILRAGGERAGYTGYVYLLSRDNGKTYQSKGFVDPANPKNVSAVTTNILTRNGTIYMVSNSYETGCLLYTSQDQGETWQRRSAVFARDDIAAPMHYPTLTLVPDGSLYVLGQARLPDLEEKNYTRISTDAGKTWGPIRLAENISVRHPVLAWLGQTLVVHGRHTPTRDVVVHYSFDNGRTWTPRQIIEDYDTDGGYSSSISIDDRLFICFSSDARKQQQPRISSIRGVFLNP